MAIVTTMRLEGDPDELLRNKREIIDPISMELAPQHGGIAHICARSDDGLLIVNLWENEEGMEKVAEQVGAKAEAAGLPKPVDWHQYELVQHETPGG